MLRDVVTACELVSVDALAVYKGMDIGTASPSRPSDPASRHRWHLVDVCEPSEEYSVARFQRDAHAAISTIHGDGRAAILVGGTGLYHRAVLDDLRLPGRYPGVAARLREEAGDGDPKAARALHARLRELDPVAAGRMEPLNLRRVLRALEVTEGSGRRFSEFGPGLETYPRTSTVLVGLRLDRAVLDERLRARLLAQIEEGFIGEVEVLRRDPLSRTARQAIGYAELLEYLEGNLGLDEALSETLRRLKAFARRQESWFRRDPRITWYDADDPRLAEHVLERWETPLS